MDRVITGDELRNATIERADASGARFQEVDLSRARLRGVYLADAEIDGEIEGLTVNGVEVKQLIDAELDRRHPERAARTATEPDDLREGWARLEAMWAPTMARAAALPPGVVDRSVDGEWSFAQTLRHLVMATDSWFGVGIQGDPTAWHPLGMPFWEWRDRAVADGMLVDATPPYEEVVAVREGRVAMVREYLATVTPEQLAEPNDGPPWAERAVTALHCIHVIANEEWEHHRFAVRDLDALDPRS